MKKGYKDHTPSISLKALGILCFVTLVMCQTRFKISKEVSHELYPPVLRSRDCWFLYTIGNPDRFKCVLRAFIVISSPVLSLISTGLLLFGKVESNPYFFIPWLFLTIKGLLLIQTDNLITILRDMATRTNYAFGFRMEDLKWILLYFTIFLIDLLEVFSFFEIFDLFLVLWNHHPGFEVETANLASMKKEIATVMEALSRCSLGSLSKISLGSTTDSEDTMGRAKELESVAKLPIKDDDKCYAEQKASLTNNCAAVKSQTEQNPPKATSEEFKIKKTLSKSLAEGDMALKSAENLSKLASRDNLKVINTSRPDLFSETIHEGIFLNPHNSSSLERNLVTQDGLSPDVLCSS